MDQDAWFCFNDSAVTAATVEDIRRTYGGSSGGWSSSNTNAYMLMYRRVRFCFVGWECSVSLTFLNRKCRGCEKATTIYVIRLSNSLNFFS